MVSNEKKTDENKERKKERTESLVNAVYAKRNGYGPTKRDILFNEYVSNRR